MSRPTINVRELQRRLQLAIDALSDGDSARAETVASFVVAELAAFHAGYPVQLSIVPAPAARDLASVQAARRAAEAAEAAGGWTMQDRATNGGMW